MKRLTFLTFALSIVSASVFLTACNTANVPTGIVPQTAQQEESEFTELTGEIKIIDPVAGTGVLLSGNEEVPLESLTLNLTEYADQTVTVRGKYSGTTLFVSEVR